MPVGLTNYTTLNGGGRGAINYGGWNTTLTDRSTTPQEVVGMMRREGGNVYLYVCGGLASAKPGWVLAPKTAVTDLGTAGYIAPICMTVCPVTANVLLPAAIAPQTMLTQLYAWVLIKGVTTANCASDAALTGGQTGYVFNVTTANCLTPGTASAHAWAMEDVGTGVASAGGVGGKVYVNFKTY